MKIERGFRLWRRAGDEFGTGHSLNEENGQNDSTSSGKFLFSL